MVDASGGSVIASLTEREWVPALADPGRLLVFPLHGYDTVAPDWGFENRTLPDHLLYLLTGGEVSGEIGGQTLRLRPGSLLWMQPGTQHTFRLALGAGPPTVYFVRFRIGPPGRELALAGPRHRQWEEAWDLRGHLDELTDELRTRLPHREQRARALLLSVCTSALRRREHDESPAASGSLSRTQRRTIESLVRTAPRARIGVRELAEGVGLSPDYLTRLFTATYGVPPRVWLVDERLRRGARALSDSLQNVTEIATSLGYDDVTAFSHQFKQRYGVSPRTYRRTQMEVTRP